MEFWDIFQNLNIPTPSTKAQRHYPKEGIFKTFFPEWLEYYTTKHFGIHQREQYDQRSKKFDEKGRIVFRGKSNVEAFTKIADQMGITVFSDRKNDLESGIVVIRRTN